MFNHRNQLQTASERHDKCQCAEINMCDRYSCISHKNKRSESSHILSYLLFALWGQLFEILTTSLVNVSLTFKT